MNDSCGCAWHMTVTAGLLGGKAGKVYSQCTSSQNPKLIYPYWGGGKEGYRPILPCSAAPCTACTFQEQFPSVTLSNYDTNEISNCKVWQSVSIGDGQ